MALRDKKRQFIGDKVGGFLPRERPDWGNLTSEQKYGAQMLLKSGYTEVPQSYRQGDYDMGSVMTIGNKRYGIPAGSGVSPVSAEEIDRIISEGMPTKTPTLPGKTPYMPPGPRPQPLPSPTPPGKTPYTPPGRRPGEMPTVIGSTPVRPTPT